MNTSHREELIEKITLIKKEESVLREEYSRKTNELEQQRDNYLAEVLVKTDLLSFFDWGMLDSERDHRGDMIVKLYAKCPKDVNAKRYMNQVADLHTIFDFYYHDSFSTDDYVLRVDDNEITLYIKMNKLQAYKELMGLRISFSHLEERCDDITQAIARLIDEREQIRSFIEGNDV